MEGQSSKPPDGAKTQELVINGGPNGEDILLRIYSLVNLSTATTKRPDGADNEPRPITSQSTRAPIVC